MLHRRGGGVAGGPMAVKYVPNRAAVKELLRSPGVQAEVNRHASRIAHTASESAGAPGGYVVSARQGRSRFRAIVYADTLKAKRREASGNHLVRSLG